MFGFSFHLSFRAKLAISVAVFTVVLTSFSLYYFYWKIQSIVFQDTQDKLLAIGSLGSYLFNNENKKELSTLIEKVRLNYKIPENLNNLLPGETLNSLSEEKIASLQSSEEFIKIVQLLRKIKEATRKNFRQNQFLEQYFSKEEDPPIINFCYILAPLKDLKEDYYFIFIADANYEEIDLNQDGVIDENEVGSPIGSIYNAKNFSNLIKAAKEKKPYTDDQFEMDKWGVTLSAYIPILDSSNELLAIIGIDMDVQNEHNQLNNLLHFYFFIIFFVFLFTLTISFFLARYLTKNLAILHHGVERVKKKDFNTSIIVKTKDEIGSVAETFNSMVASIREYANDLEKQTSAFHRFVPTEFIQLLDKNSAVEVSLGNSNPYIMSVLFSDIRSFTSISENMGYEKIFLFLNEYISRMEPHVQAHSGFVDKFIGDAIMALFPAVKPKENIEELYESISISAMNAVDAALAMLVEVKEFNKYLLSKQENPISIGIGITTGSLILGIVGSSNRLESTVIGNTVNLAARIESLTNYYKSNLLISEFTHVVLPERKNYLIREIDFVIPKGTTYPFYLYEVFNADEEETKQRKLESKETFEKAIQNYRNKNFLTSKKLFFDVLKIFPNDPISQMYIERIQYLLRNPLPSNWQGEWKFSEK